MSRAAILAGAIGTAAAVGLGIALVPLMNEDHTFNPSPDVTSRESRAKKLGLARDERCKLPGLTEYFLNKDNLYIHWRKWVPRIGIDPSPSKGLVIIVHGLAEHCARYSELVRSLNAAGFVVYALDHQGHGRSEGDRIYVKDFHDYARDVLVLTKFAKKDYPTLKTYIIGHSLGGAVTVDALATAPEGTFDGAVISAPAMKVDESQVTPVTLFAVKHLGNYIPKLRVDKLDVATLCLESSVVDLYMNDPLVAQDMLPARTAWALLDFMGSAMTTASKITVPYLLIHGSRDKICAIEGSEDFHAHTKSEKKVFKVIEGGYHETLFENTAHVKTVVDYLSSSAA